LAQQQVRFERPVTRGPIRALNAIGRALDKLGYQPFPLHEESLLATARKRSGLGDFEDQSFREPLRLLLGDLDREGALHTFGRFYVRAFFAGLLRNRLQLEDWWRRHPEILEGEIRAPLFILGLPRTGTTLMQNLLSADPRARFLRFWEAAEPCPPPSRDTFASDPRRAFYAQWLRRLDYLSPHLRAMHEFELEGPEECYALLSNTMVGVHFHWIYDAPSYQPWLARQDLRPSYEFFRRALLLLQWKWPGRHWVLKSPVHLQAVGALLAVFPDARIVQMHRDPTKVAASICSLAATLRGLGNDRLDPLAFGDLMMTSLGEGIDRCMEVRTATGSRAFHDVHYDDLLRDPLAAVRGIWERFDIEPDAEAEANMRRLLAERPQHKHGVHRYSLEQWGLDAERVRRRFAHYTETFAVRPEA